MAKKGLAVAAAFFAFVSAVLFSGVLSHEKDGFLWAFESAVISEDGTQLTVEAYRPGDASCHHYSHITTQQRGSDLIVSLFHKRTESRFCEMPCPIGSTTPHTIRLDPPVDPSLTVTRHPDTAPHCSENMQDILGIPGPLIVETTRAIPKPETVPGRLIRKNGCLILAADGNETSLVFEPERATPAGDRRGIVLDRTTITFRSKVVVTGEPTNATEFEGGLINSLCPSDVLIVKTIKPK